MITKIEFAKIYNEVDNAIEDALNALFAFNQNSYALFLADGEYTKTVSGYSPFSIDYRVDGYLDETRLRFLSQFLNEHYSFAPPLTQTVDDEYRIQIELMIYTHIWEALPFIKKLYRLAQLLDGKNYKWCAQVPLMGKHNFIRLKIRDVFKRNGHTISEIMSKGFHSSLRNSFAHSQYAINSPFPANKIVLFNGSGLKKNKLLPEISFDDWSKRFAYSFLLSYLFVKKADEHRRNLITKTGTDIFQIKIPHKTKTYVMDWIKYEPVHNNFSYLIN
ncbi:MAG: hypothetical protein JSR97_07955 [Verrucomicrobia bacterium]|nr:hypothetical protein [Verrucomicrobiota bacterium]